MVTLSKIFLKCNKVRSQRNQNPLPLHIFGEHKLRTTIYFGGAPVLRNILHLVEMRTTIKGFPKCNII